jgi:hypothetical protein
MQTHIGTIIGSAQIQPGIDGPIIVHKEIFSSSIPIEICVHLVCLVVTDKSAREHITCELNLASGCSHSSSDDP